MQVQDVQYIPPEHENINVYSRVLGHEDDRHMWPKHVANLTETGGKIYVACTSTNEALHITVTIHGRG
jgi:hypothetical protein